MPDRKTVQVPSRKNFYRVWSNLTVRLRNTVRSTLFNLFVIPMGRPYGYYKRVRTCMLENQPGNNKHGVNLTDPEIEKLCKPWAEFGGKYYKIARDDPAKPRGYGPMGWKPGRRPPEPPPTRIIKETLWGP